MTREILFKAKRIDNGEWVEGYYQKRYDEMERERHYIFWCKSNIVWEYAEIDPDIICQYTGLTDKNGNKIWENDILCRPNKEKYVVIWRFGAFELLHRAVVTPIYAYAGTDFYIDENTLDVKVIGNIFDNPELLN